jgi:hypothetical protein
MSGVCKLVCKLGDFGPAPAVVDLHVDIVDREKRRATEKVCL